MGHAFRRDGTRPASSPRHQQKSIFIHAQDDEGREQEIDELSSGTDPAKLQFRSVAKTGLKVVRRTQNRTPYHQDRIPPPTG